jgi:hypothetical protein
MRYLLIGLGLAMLTALWTIDVPDPKSPEFYANETLGCFEEPHLEPCLD